jgi:hypothetical protein
MTIAAMVVVAVSTWSPHVRPQPPSSHRTAGLILKLSPMEECALTVGFEMNGIAECMRLMDGLDKKDSEPVASTTATAANEAHTALALCLNDARWQRSGDG